MKVGILHVKGSVYIYFRWFLFWVLASVCKSKSFSASVAREGSPRGGGGGVALYKFNCNFICMGKHTPKYLVRLKVHEVTTTNLRDQLLAVRKIYYDYCSYINRFDCKTRGPG